MKGVTREWALTLAFCLFTLLALGLGITWVNIERVDMAYELKRLQTEIDSQEALISKLEVERNTLLTPERLRVLAGQYGLSQARPGQIRRLSAAGEELPSPVIKSVPVPEKPQKKAEQPKDAGKSARKPAQKDAPEKTAKAKAEADSAAKPAKTSGDQGKSPKRTPVPYEAEPGKAKPRQQGADAARPGWRCA